MPALLFLVFGVAFLYGGARYIRDPHAPLLRAFPNHYADKQPRGKIVWFVRVGGAWCVAVGVLCLSLSFTVLGVYAGVLH